MGDVNVKGFLTLSRLPFLLPGLAALITGISIALIQGYELDFGLGAISLAGLSFIMLATYYLNEYFDYEGDSINKGFTKFSGGSRAIIDLDVPRRTAKLAGMLSIAILASIMCVYFIFYFEDYPFLVVFALAGAFFGIFYSSPPFKWAYRGVGEILIGLCYGLLAVVSGYYLVTSDLSQMALMISLPASSSIIGVILANELSDFEADKIVGKKNIVVRAGLKNGAAIYAASMAVLYPLMVLSIISGVNQMIILIGIPVLIFSLVPILLLRNGGYSDRGKQMKISGLTLIANLLSSLLFIMAFVIQ